jgi:hypothetical protein
MFVARQRLDKHVPGAKNTQSTTEGLLGYNGGNCFFSWASSEAIQRAPQAS